MSALVLSGLAKSFKDSAGAARSILSGIELSLAEGELLALVGPSGCGKSTLLNIVAGLTPPDEGMLRLPLREGRDARVAYIFQQPRLLDWLSVRKNVELAVRSMGGDLSLIDEMLDAVGLAEHADAFPSRLSGGQRQRVSIARSFATDPDVLLLDEPFGALDELTARRLRALLQDLWMARGRIGLLVTHNTMEAVMLADRIVVLGGRPTRIVDEIQVALPRPRSPEDERAFRLARAVVASLEAAAEDSESLR